MSPMLLCSRKMYLVESGEEKFHVFVYAGYNESEQKKKENISIYYADSDEEVLDSDKCALILEELSKYGLH